MLVKHVYVCMYSYISLDLGVTVYACTSDSALSRIKLSECLLAQNFGCRPKPLTTGAEEHQFVSHTVFLFVVKNQAVVQFT